MTVFFFFSSRRRHTRFDCDWSSDVCSSDLDGRARGARARPSSWAWTWACPPSPSCGGRPPPRAACSDGSPSDRASLPAPPQATRSEEHTSELQSQSNLVCRLLLEKKKRRRQRILASRQHPAQQLRIARPSP